MPNLNWKLEKINNLNDEVRDLHPVLLQLFKGMPQIKEVIYTQGNRENGADFVLIKNDDVLDQEEYVGVVVKSSSIRQNCDDVHRQIKECTLAPRPVENGKKNVYLTEIWVVTSKDITRNAEELLHLEYKTTKLKFIDGNKLVTLLDRNFPEYWNFIDANVGRYVADQHKALVALNNLHRMLPVEFGRVVPESEIVKIPNDSKRKFNVAKARPTRLWDEIKRHKLLFLQGGMGSGKSDLLRATALTMCEQGIVAEFSFVPYFTAYRDWIKNPDFNKVSFIDQVHSMVGDSSKTVVIFIDGLDESLDSNAVKVDNICALANLVNLRNDTKVVVGSRVIDEDVLNIEIAKSFDRYSVCALTFNTLVNFVQKICENIEVSSKLKTDLQRSPLMRALPRTPLSAILLGKILKEKLSDLPSTLPELYSKYVELVLGRWDLKKGNGTEKEYETLQRLTSMIATYFLDNDIDAIGVGELKNMFRSYLDDRKTGQDLDPMLGIFLKTSELISYDADEEVVRFRHKSFAEYFYAHALLMDLGKGAPVNRPFDENWFAIEYFYLGLVRDVPDRIQKLSRYVPQDHNEEFIKLCHFGSFLMAAYQTPYSTIADALYQSFRDSAIYHTKVVTGEHKDWLSKFPELQILAFFTKILRSSYSYDFFRPALVDARVQAELDERLSESEQITLIFFIDAILCELRDGSAFQNLIDRHEAQLSWTIRLGIYHASADVEFVNSATKLISRRMEKSIKGNSAIRNFLHTLETTPLQDRKDVKKNTDY